MRDEIERNHKATSAVPTRQACGDLPSARWRGCTRDGATAARATRASLGRHVGAGAHQAAQFVTFDGGGQRDGYRFPLKDYRLPLIRLSLTAKRLALSANRIIAYR